MDVLVHRSLSRHWQMDEDGVVGLLISVTSQIPSSQLFDSLGNKESFNSDVEE